MVLVLPDQIAQIIIAVLVFYSQESIKLNLLFQSMMVKSLHYIAPIISKTLPFILQCTLSKSYYKFPPSLSSTFDSSLPPSIISSPTLTHHLPSSPSFPLPLSSTSLTSSIPHFIHPSFQPSITSPLPTHRTTAIPSLLAYGGKGNDRRTTKVLSPCPRIKCGETKNQF